MPRRSCPHNAHACVCGHSVYDNQETRCPLCACQEHRARLLLTAGDHSTPAAVPPGIAGEWSGPQPELPGAVPVLPLQRRIAAPEAVSANARRRASPRQPAARAARPWAVSGAHSPRAGATVPVPAIPRRPRASGPAVAALAPACREREYPAHMLPRSPQSAQALPGGACRRKCPADLPLRAPTTVGTAARKSLAAVPRIPAGNQPVRGVSTSDVSMRVPVTSRFH
jgi:hypothetical protein